MGSNFNHFQKHDARFEVQRDNLCFQVSQTKIYFVSIVFEFKYFLGN